MERQGALSRAGEKENRKVPEIGNAALHREIAKLRKKIKDLQLEVSGLRLVTEVLWEASEIRSGHAQYDSCSAQGMEKQTARIVAAEMKRLRDMFRRCVPV